MKNPRSGCRDQSPRAVPENFENDLVSLTLDAETLKLLDGASEGQGWIKGGYTGKKDGFNGGKDGRAWIGGVGEGGVRCRSSWLGTVFLMRYSLKVLLTCSIALA